MAGPVSSVLVWYNGRCGIRFCQFFDACEAVGESPAAIGNILPISFRVPNSQQSSLLLHSGDVSAEALGTFLTMTVLSCSSKTSRQRVFSEF